MVISAVEKNEQSAGVRPTVRTPAGAGRNRRRPVRWIWFLIPSLVLVLIFFITPFVLNIPFAFTQWTAYSPDIKFNGLDNFAFLWQNGTLQSAVVVTLIYAVVAMTVQNVTALSLALALRKTTRINSVYRSIFFLPVLISPLAAGYIWRGLVDPQGPLNAVIAVVIPGFQYAWLGHPVSALVTVAFIDGWKWSGIATLVYIAGLNSIPDELMEAAQLDGAGPFKRFWRISFPLLAPAFTFNIATTLIGALSAYDVIASTTSGGPGNATTTINVALQQQFGLSFYGTASALGLTVTMLVIVIAVPLVFWLRRREVA
ncbi:ABC transporter permease [Microbacterium mangrovi]|uniref:ABC transporter permease n=1 Tax=Microbacterium mangrovi TaxID=1348253 RepID=A0A0B2AB23_9MICO|nr:sugar ABC transporter permease [Microbacterium mangrovi]KHK98801.1 ABC transporter permease [Microbacterium mangrovi]